MATVRQYYDSDFKDFGGPEGPIPLRTPDGQELTPPVMWKMLLGQDSRAAFFVCYVPTMTDSRAAAFAVIDNFDWLMRFKNTISISQGFANEPMTSLDECVFTGRLIIYVEADLPAEVKSELEVRIAIWQCLSGTKST
jgi:hypothetical protein